MSWLDTLEAIRKKDYSKVPLAEREQTARDVVNFCSYAVAVVAVSPIPFSDGLLIFPIQVGMVMTVAHVYGRRADDAEAKELVVELGTLAGVSFLARQGVKALLPLVGALMTVPAAFAANWAIGRAAMAYFQDPSLSKTALKSIYQRAQSEAKGEFSKEKFAWFRKQHQDDVEAVAQPAKKKPASKARKSAKKSPRARQ